MCMVYFIGTDKDIPLIEFNSTEPAFHVIELSEQEQIVQEHFSKLRVHYIGSSQGCGCGFRAQPSCVYDPDSEEFSTTIKDHNALADYLDQLMVLGEKEIELYGCWSGDEKEKSESRRECSTSDIRQNAFQFNEREFLVIKKSDYGE